MEFLHCVSKTATFINKWCKGTKAEAVLDYVAGFQAIPITLSCRSDTSYPLNVKAFANISNTAKTQESRSRAVLKIQNEMM